MKSLWKIINLRTLLVTVTAIISTWLCIKYQVTADFPLTLVATAVVFPVVFSINGAYKRREKALTEYSALKANGRAIFFATRDWLENPSPDLLQSSREQLQAVLAATSEMLSGSDANLRNNEEAVYRAFSQLSRFIKSDLRGNGLASGEVSRCNQYLSKMLFAFENIKHIFQYRTPKTLRTFSAVFISLLPIIYGPYFASQASDYSHYVTYAMPILFSLVLVSLSNIQAHLENPFDQIGEDDIQFHVDAFAKNLYD
ncbi:MAG: hypothetical protein OIF34_08935 [Porticoccaceae bacterium]|nr:hypothetical protein [Porticoccaceae bacterium]